MAHADPLPVAVLDSVSRQVGRNLSGLASLAPGATPVRDELADSYAVWMLEDKAITKFSSPLNEVARNTGNWHHQIRRIASPPGGAQTERVVAYARSEPRGATPGDWAVVSTTEVSKDFPLGSEISNAAAWIDSNGKDDPLVRLLVIPSRYLHAFWLAYPDRDEVVVIDMPNAYSHLKYQVVYSATDFLKHLSRERVVRGVGNSRY